MDRRETLSRYASLVMNHSNWNVFLQPLHEGDNIIAVRATPFQVGSPIKSLLPMGRVFDKGGLVPDLSDHKGDSMSVNEILSQFDSSVNIRRIPKDHSKSPRAFVLSARPSKLGP